MKAVLEDYEIKNLIAGQYYGDPFSLLGMHQDHTSYGEAFIFVRTFQPQAQSVEIIKKETNETFQMSKIHQEGLFQFDFMNIPFFFEYKFKIHLYSGETYETEDVYRFLPVLGEMDTYLFNEGNHKEIYEKLGSHLIEHQNVSGVSFAVWAPNARRVSVVGTFNDWDGRRHMMRPLGSSGVWEVFIPHLPEWSIYKYEIIGADGELLPLKIDPYGFAFEMRPKTGTLVFNQKKYKWNDDQWISQKRYKANALASPISIYEVHLGSWRRNSLEENRWLTYREMAKELPAYVQEMGFTHVEFLPVSEYPFDGSWGYQVTGMFAPTSRYGTPDDFKYLIDELHRRDIAVIIDWVPAHFPKDAFGLSEFDGTALYEHADPRKGEHRDWGTKIYNYSRNEVSNFLLSNALFWIREYHIDALRVDAVASMLYLDYSRQDGEWIPNQYGGRENLEAIAFLRRLNEFVFGENAGVTTFAEESTAWPMVSKPTYIGGLGFGYKWNMGWMHDTLEYMHYDPIYRQYHHNELTFSMLYAFTENFTLPLSHDEVVHGKGPIYDKMSGDNWQKVANLRLYYAYMFMHPGKKLLFMGNELGETKEWNYADSLNWGLLKKPLHKELHHFIKELNTFYKTHTELTDYDFDSKGFEWIDGSDSVNSCFTFMRKNKKGDTLVIACNFTPVLREAYKIGVNDEGSYKMIFNSDDASFGGSGSTINKNIETGDGWNFKPYAITVDLPPLSVVVFQQIKK